MSSRATGRVSRAIMVSSLVLVIKADEWDRPPWTLRRGLPMKNSGNDAGHPDESDLLDAQMNSGIPLIRAGRARLRLALPRYRDKIPSTHKLAFQSLRRVYEVTALMVDELRKEVPCREELLAEYEEICRGIEADAVAMLEGETSDRWC
ncbi:hypothetical protein GOB43_10670 [Sinorhizobium meliloti]|nr:hypothetical protein [Sinorhizobium meliloti]MDW9443582.1 hypothetical protein [Sinorhizobium meliloti]MDW9456068.1 hypothetical protein [Sinorhizobium meliloti]MDW9468877.1 hypothetical protein [Sinorhizobium meliloti]MDW9517761.1 hypothetical protein [Sinorhizobium meliloti]